MHVQFQQNKKTIAMELFLIRCILLSLVIGQSIIIFAVPSTPTISVEQGKLDGLILTSQSGRSYSAFYNIPYAEAGRFRAPTVASKWQGIFLANEEGPECAYDTWFTHQRKGVEDCLSLNIFTPANLSACDQITLLPVLVYLHGGVFTLSTRGNFLVSYMMNEDVVFVPIKFRVGPFGFLSTGDKVIPGNFGLKDQNMALRWIQANIKQFGGDPDNVVLLGNGAGAVSANLHMLSEMSSGLFHAAILHSGTALVPWGLVHKPTVGARLLGKTVKCPYKNSGSLLACLLNKTTEEILFGMRELLVHGPHPFAPFAPVVEPDFPGAFIKKAPYDILKNKTGIVNKVPVIIGTTEEEDIFKRVAYIAAHPSLQRKINRNWKKLFPVIFEYSSLYVNFTQSEVDWISRKVRKFYFNGQGINQDNQDALQKALADRMINYGMKKTITLMARQVPVYAFLLDSSEADTIENHRKVDAAMDGSPNIVAKSLKAVADFYQRNQADEVLKNLTSLIAAFARDKKPIPWGTEKDWGPISKTADIDNNPIKYLRFGPDTSLVPEPFTKGVQFWTITFQHAIKKLKKRQKNKKHKSN